MQETKFIFSEEEKIKYTKLAAKVTSEYQRLFDRGNFGRIRNKSPKRYNKCLKEMKEFLSALPGDFSNNRFMKADYMLEHLTHPSRPAGDKI